jgi:hypothetical protein
VTGVAAYNVFLTYGADLSTIVQSSEELKIPVTSKQSLDYLNKFSTDPTRIKRRTIHAQ